MPRSIYTHNIKLMKQLRDEIYTVVRLQIYFSISFHFANVHNFRKFNLKIWIPYKINATCLSHNSIKLSSPWISFWKCNYIFDTHRNKITQRWLCWEANNHWLEKFPCSIVNTRQDSFIRQRDVFWMIPMNPYVDYINFN